MHLGLYSLSGRTSYGKISRILEAARFGFKHLSSLWNLTGTSAAPLPRCLLNFRAIRSLWHPISRIRDFARFGGKTSYRLVNRGPESDFVIHSFHKMLSPETAMQLYHIFRTYECIKCYPICTIKLPLTHYPPHFPLTPQFIHLTNARMSNIWTGPRDKKIS